MSWTIKRLIDGINFNNNDANDNDNDNNSNSNNNTCCEYSLLTF